MINCFPIFSGILKKTDDQEKTDDQAGGWKLCWENGTKSHPTWHTLGTVPLEKQIQRDVKHRLVSTWRHNEEGFPHPDSLSVAPALRASMVPSSVPMDLTSSHPSEDTGIPGAHMTAALQRNPAKWLSASLLSKFKIYKERSVPLHPLAYTPEQRGGKEPQKMERRKAGVSVRKSLGLTDSGHGGRRAAIQGQLGSNTAHEPPWAWWCGAW